VASKLLRPIVVTIKRFMEHSNFLDLTLPLMEDAPTLNSDWKSPFPKVVTL
jgi:hypothetical protein